MSCMAAERDVLHGWRQRCLEWPEMTVDSGTDGWHSAILVC